MHKLLSILACAGVAATALPSHALTFVSAAAQGNSVAAAVTDAFLPTIAADIGFAEFGTVSLTFQLSAADAGGLAAFNAVIDNLMVGRGIAGLELSLNRGTFELVGAVTPSFSAVASVLGTPQYQRISFAPAEVFGVDLGNPFAAAGQADWLFGFAGMQAGETFTLTVSAVPEPHVWTLMLAGVGMLALMRRPRSPAERVAGA